MVFNTLGAAVGFIIALTAFQLTEVGALAPQPPGNCTRECGGVKIPYPFSVDDTVGCQIVDTLRPGFKLDCIERGNRAGKRLYYANQEVLDISLHNGYIRWLNNISSYCLNATGHMELNSTPTNMDLESSIFRVSTTANKFTVLGCKTLAYIGDTQDPNSYKAVCGSTCSDGDFSSLINGACDGIGCCQTAIPKGLANYRVWFDDNFSIAEVYKSNKTGRCSYAALVDGANFTFSSSYLSSSTAFVNAYGYDGQMPLVVDWAIGNQTCELVPAESYVCASGNSVCVNSSTGQGYICNCAKGYTGNPYLLNGCQDVNECLDKNNCDGTCHNTIGSFICCPLRTKYDPKKMQCTSTKQKNLIIGTCKPCHLY